MKKGRVLELFLQFLETEQRSLRIYEAARECAVCEELRGEWDEQIGQVCRHVEIMRELCEGFALDPQVETRGRRIVRHIGDTLLGAIREARMHGDAAGAQLVAVECVVLAEAKSRMNWELLAEIARAARAETRMALEDAHRAVADEEKRRLRRTRRWLRELWRERLGLAARLPPSGGRGGARTLDRPAAERWPGAR